MGGGRACCASFVARGGEDVEGALVFEGFRDSLPFRVCAPPPSTAAISFAGATASNFVVERGLLRATVITAAADVPNADAGGVDSLVTAASGDAPPSLPAGAKGAPGIAADLCLSKDNPARLLVPVRRASDAEAAQAHAAAVAAAEEKSYEDHRTAAD